MAADARDAARSSTLTVTCIETICDRFEQVRLLDEDVTLLGFALDRHAVIAECRKVHVTLDSIKFPSLTPIERLWLRACKRYSAATG